MSILSSENAVRLNFIIHIMFLALFEMRNYNVLCGVRNGLYDIERGRQKWGVTPRRVNYYCTADRIPGAVKMAGVWLVPKDADKPIDGRTKQGKALKHETI